MSENKNFDIETEIVTLTDEEGNETNFEIIGSIELDDNFYYALVPENSDADEYIILKASLDENDEEILITIDDDDEFDRVADEFDNELFAEYDYDEEESEDEE